MVTAATPLLILWGSQTGNAQVRNALLYIAVHRCASASSLKTSCQLVQFFWSSEISQDVAERIEREARIRHYSPRVQSMDSYVITELPNEQNVIFVASTTGQVLTGIHALPVAAPVVSMSNCRRHT